MPTLKRGRSSRRLALTVGVLTLTIVVLLTGLPLAPATAPGLQMSSVAQAQTAPLQQMRAFWADSFNPGYLNHAEVDELVANVVRANANTIIAQMRRHGDAWYNNSIEPRAAQNALAPADQFDPLAYLITKAHAHGIRVHAWLVVSVVCRRTDRLYGHPDHLCTDHGPETSGTDRWTTETYGGQQIGDLDFGHPGAIIHFENVVQHLIRHYPQVDGIHLDFIRYGDIAYGYNQVSLDRFRRVHGLSANYRPVPSDPLWSQWRRDRVAEMVRRVYIRSKAIKPTIEVSIAAITWGGIGSYTPDDWPNSSAYSTVFQDWKAYLQEGIIDFAVPMHYFEEGLPRSRSWYDSWLAWGRVNTGRRAIVAGTGAWLNTAEQGISQIERAITPDAAGRALSGVSLYSYDQPLAGGGFERRRQFMDQLRASVFSQPAQAPDWPWVYHHWLGHLQGIAAIDGEIISDYRVSLVKDGKWLRDIPTAYDGWYGAVDLEPGTYQVVVKHPSNGKEAWHQVIVEAGRVTNGP